MLLIVKSKAKLPVNKVGKTNMDYIYHHLLKLYSGVSSGIADGIAIENGKAVYIVDSGRDNRKLDFGVRRMRIFSADIARELFIRRGNDKARSNGNISDELLGKFGYGRSSDSGRDLRRESGSELQAVKGKSENQQSGISQKNADNGGLVSQYSSPEEAKASGKASRELDTEYLSAVNRGDMETTQRMDGDSNIRYSLADTLTITDVTRMRFAVGIFGNRK